MAKTPVKLKRQVAALPYYRDAEGQLWVYLVTSRRSRRFIIPKGQRESKLKDHEAAALEAWEEAGLSGSVHKKSLGRFLYWKRRADHFELQKVKVYLLEVTAQALDWKERGERVGAWLSLEDAVDLVDDRGLVPILRKLHKLARHAGPKRRDR